MQTGSKEGEVVAGRYRLAGRLGSGGMGTVWRADDVLLERAVAVKEICIPGGLPAPEAERLRQRYLREARAAARLRHENVIVVHDVIPEAARVLIVMELVDTPDLAALVRDGGGLDPVSAARIGLQLLDALTAAHAAGVLHRDVKPANVLLCENGRAVLTDFGVASVTGDASLTATGQLIGSPAYLAPERLTGGTVGPASDLWALGCTLYAALEGQSPFWREEPFAILAAITVEALPMPDSAGPLKPVLIGLLEKEQKCRWDADRTRAALRRVVAGEHVDEVPAWGMPIPLVVDPGRPSEPEPPSEPVSAPPVEPASLPEPEEPPPGPARRTRRRVLAVIGIVVLLALVGGAAEYMFHPFGVNVSVLRALAGTTDGDGQPEVPAQPVQIVHPDSGHSILLPPEWSHRDATDAKWRFTRHEDVRESPDYVMSIYVQTVPAGGRSSLDLARAEDTRLANAKETSWYKRIRLEAIMYGQYRGAVLEFTQGRPGVGPVHQVVFRTVFQNVSYEISLVGPSEQFDSAWSAFVNVARSLQLPE